MKPIFTTIILLSLAAVAIAILIKNPKDNETQTPASSPSSTSSVVSPALMSSPSPAGGTSSPTPGTSNSVPTSSLIEPLPEFKQRITKKPFGIYIDPDTSPVQPERFNGYHTGVDVEYVDITQDTPVKAIADGERVEARTVSGYGGVIIIRHTINNKPTLVLYGHLDPKSFITKTTIKQGDIIGQLGEDKSTETDGERKHLHLAILKNNSVSYAGYVQTKEALQNWYDPLEFYK